MKLFVHLLDSSMKNKFFDVLYPLVFLSAALSVAQNRLNDDVPQRIILNLTEHPSHSIAVTWRTNTAFPNSEAQYAEATPWIEFEKTVSKTAAKSVKFEAEKDRFVFHYSAILDNLKPSTPYLYRVGHDSVWSEWNQFKTASDKDAPFKFVFLADAQNDIKEHVSRVFRQAYKIAPDADFWLFSGDLVKEPKDALWDEFFYAAGFIPRVMPSIMTPGNHDQLKILIDGNETKTTPPIWKAHFTLPENGISGLEETCYYVDYQGVRFVMLNTNEKKEEQAQWLDKLLSDNPNTWTIVSFHYPFYNTGSDHITQTTREIFAPIIDKYNADLALVGHDHTYARSFKLRGGKIAAAGERGTVYVLSVSGPKAYDVNPFYKDIMVKMANQVQLFQVISIEGNKLVYKSYTATGSLFDSFELLKK